MIDRATSLGENHSPASVNYLGHAPQRFVHIRNLGAGLQGPVLLGLCYEQLFAPIMSVNHLIPAVRIWV